MIRRFNKKDFLELIAGQAECLYGDDNMEIDIEVALAKLLFVMRESCAEPAAPGDRDLVARLSVQ